MTLLSPLNTFVRLLTTMSASGSTSTLTNPAIVSSTTIMKPNSSASLRRSCKGGERKSGLDGNSQKTARMGGLAASSVCRRAGRSDVRPLPKKWQPGPHFCKILSVSVYGKLRGERGTSDAARAC